MNISQLTEAAVAEQLGVLLLENTKLKALLAMKDGEIARLKAEAKQNGDSNAGQPEMA